MKSENTPEQQEEAPGVKQLNITSPPSVMITNTKENENKEKTSLISILRFTTRKDHFLLVAGIVFALIHGTLEPLTFVVAGDVFNSLNAPSPTGSTEAALKYLYLASAALVSATLQVLCFSILSSRIAMKIKMEYFNACLRQDIAYFDKNPFGKLSGLASNNVPLIQKAFGTQLGMSFQLLATTLGGFIIAFVYSWQLALLMSAVLPILAVLSEWSASMTEKLSKEENKVYAACGVVVEETISLIRLVTAFGLQQKKTKEFTDNLVPVKNTLIKQGKIKGIGTAVVFGFMYSTYAIGLYVGAVLIVASKQNAANSHPVSTPPPFAFCALNQTGPSTCGSFRFNSMSDVCSCYECGCGCFASGVSCTSPGAIFIAFFAISIAAMSLGQAVPGYESLVIAKVCLGSLLEVIDRKPEIVEDKTDAIVLRDAEVKGELDFHDVTFSYPMRAEVTVFSNLNLKFPAGKRVGVCGPSGTGKSTIIQLIQRFYDPSSGSILLDGVDIRNIKQSSLRSFIGLVSQEPILFAGVSLKENIRFGKPEASDEEVEQACVRANAFDFINKFPARFETNVGMDGTSMSGGQRQRVAIARALIRSPKILLFDEATAALDYESERLVNEAIEDLSAAEKRTMIIVAHRLTSIQTCDIIVCMGEKGKVEEVGTHAELMAKQDGVYRSLYSASMKKSEDGARNNNNNNNNADNDDNDEHGNPRGVSPESGGVVSRVKSSSEVEASALEEKEQSEKKIPISRTFQFVSKEKWWFLPAVAFTALNGAMEPIAGLLLSQFIAVYYNPNSNYVLSESGVTALKFFGIACGKFFGGLIGNYSFGVINSNMTIRVRQAVFTHLLGMDIEYFDNPKNNVGVLSNRISEDARLVKASLGNMAFLVSANLSTVVVGLIISFTASWKITLVIMAIFPIMILGYVMDLQSKESSTYGKEKHGGDYSNQTVAETLKGIKTVSAFNMKQSIKRLYETQLQLPLQSLFRVSLKSGLAFGFAKFVVFNCYGIIFYYGSTLIISGEVSFLNFVIALVTVVFIADAIGYSVSMVPDIGKGGKALQGVFSILDEKPKIDSYSSRGLKPSTVLGEVVLSNVDFVYPSRPDAKILHNFNLEIKRGSIVAFVGASGSGKSTVIQLLERFYDPKKGSVILDGVDYKDLNLTWLREQISIVPQEPYLFNTSIRENILNGRLDASEGEIEQAARNANAYDFIQALPDKFETLCGSKGNYFLSGGQKQRICLARALLRKPQLLLLDEATSALDEKSQSVVQQALDRLFETKACTTIVIAHRLSTVKNCDLICVLSEGKIVETGTFDELQAKANGVFRALLESQNLQQSEKN